MFMLILFYELLVIFFVECSIIETTSGPIKGALLEYDGFYYHAYQGIPYAESPEGALRFKPPIPVKPWHEVFDATKEGPVCPQSDLAQHERKNMSEDCLRINIFVPAKNSSSPRPVLFFIHGGFYKLDSGNVKTYMGPELLLQRDIIVVTANSRLGAMGYLSFGVEEASGNAGIKDIILALKWLNENIRIFGGSTVTIGGTSSGAALVQLLMMTEKSSGLFQRAIIMGGCASNPRSFSTNPIFYAKYLAKKLGFATDNVQKTIQNLTNANIFDIIEVQENMFNEYRCNPIASEFMPCVEVESSHAVLTQDPIKIIESGMPQSVPILVTGTSEEAFILLRDKSYPTLKKIETCMPLDLEYPIDSDEFNTLVTDVATFYFENERLSNVSIKAYVDMLTDTQYLYATNKWIKLHANRQDSKPLYYGIFNFMGLLNYSKWRLNNHYPWASHADEYSYVFLTNATRPFIKNLDARTERVKDLMLNFTSNFIKYGNPTPEEEDEDIKWPPTGKLISHLLINDNPEVVNHVPFENRTEFWDNVYQKYRIYVENNGITKPRYY